MKSIVMLLLSFICYAPHTTNAWVIFEGCKKLMLIIKFTSSIIQPENNYASEKNVKNLVNLMKEVRRKDAKNRKSK